MTPMHTDADTDRHCIDLTQLSSREQLSALMDGALPEDQTRFLLRRLQHDAELAGSWERWRIASDVMRGLAPARHLPADFASRVGAALRGEDAVAAQARAAALRPVWLRRGAGIGALAAALGLVALLARPALDPDVAVGPVAQEVAATRSAVAMPAAQQVAPTPAPAPQAETPDRRVASAAVAVTTPLRRSKLPSASPMATPAQAERVGIAAATPPAAEPDMPAAAFPVLPSTDSVPRPWPRSILSQYGSGGSLAVGFGEHLPRTADNPFTPSAFRAPPTLLSDVAATPAQDDGPSGSQPQP